MMDQAADGVWLVTGTDVNWLLAGAGPARVTPATTSLPVLQAH